MPNIYRLRPIETTIPPDARTRLAIRTAPLRSKFTLEEAIVESWAEGYHVGSLIILILIVFCNYRRRVFLHKLILVELILALWHGSFIFAEDPTYGWYLSSTAALLFVSYQIHNVVSWLKISPFLPKWGSRVFIGTLILVQPFWVAEAWSNFEYFNGLGNLSNIKMRPWEALCRDPWWIFTTWKLLNVIGKSYGFKVWELVKMNSRFGVMLLCMFLSIAFILADVIVSAAKFSVNSGINPYWRLALVFKCASDVIFLDDFKTVLDEIVHKSLSRIRDTDPQEDARQMSITQRSQHGAFAVVMSHPKKNRFFNRSSDSASDTPNIHVERETTVVSQRRGEEDPFEMEERVSIRPESRGRGSESRLRYPSPALPPPPSLLKSAKQM